MTDILSTKDSNPYYWEDDSRESQEEGSSILQTSMDDRDDSSTSVQVGGPSPGEKNHFKLYFIICILIYLRIWS